jgi:probable phosphoglycerate mutase
MILEKDFYFVRHGQTDHNISQNHLNEDHPHHTPLNITGRKQAVSIEPTIATLPVKTVCCSPLKRAQETKELITTRLQVEHHALDDLGECTSVIWREMVRLGMHGAAPDSENVQFFMEKVRKGINHALSLPGPTLIVAHGGVHWAMCALMRIKDHEWAIDNCVPVYFSVRENGLWVAKKLNS